MALSVTWGKCLEGKWCNFLNLNLANEFFDNLEGVYIIWQRNGTVIRVGQGIIRDRLTAHRNDEKILAYKKDGLFVTWAEVPTRQRDGVERYLAEHFKPLIGEKFPDVDPIEVNLPG